MDEPEKANDGLRSGALFSGRAGDSMQRVVLCSHWCALAVVPNPSTHTEGRVTAFIRVLESRLRGNSPERFGRGERLQGPTYPYKRARNGTSPAAYFMGFPTKKGQDAHYGLVTCRLGFSPLSFSWSISTNRSFLWGLPSTYSLLK